MRFVWNGTVNITHRNGQFRNSPQKLRICDELLTSTEPLTNPLRSSAPHSDDLVPIWRAAAWLGGNGGCAGKYDMQHTNPTDARQKWHHNSFGISGEQRIAHIVTQRIDHRLVQITSRSLCQNCSRFGPRVCEATVDSLRVVFSIKSIKCSEKDT